MPQRQAQREAQREAQRQAQREAQRPRPWSRPNPGRSRPPAVALTVRRRPTGARATPPDRARNRQVGTDHHQPVISDSFALYQRTP
jgi:hypothetical protein